MLIGPATSEAAPWKHGAWRPGGLTEPACNMREMEPAWPDPSRPSSKRTARGIAGTDRSTTCTPGCTYSKEFLYFIQLLDENEPWLELGFAKGSAWAGSSVFKLSRQS